MSDARADIRCTRRELWRTLFRGAALGGVTVVTAALVARRGDVTSEDPCINKGFCRRCSVVRGCGLPAALSYKQAMSNQRDG